VRCRFGSRGVNDKRIDPATGERQRFSSVILPAWDGTLAALCALTQKPVVGSGLRAGAVGMDKWVTKVVAEAIGIRVAPGRLVCATDMGDIEFETEVVVKPVSAGSSYGVTFVRDACQLDEALPPGISIRLASRSGRSLASCPRVDTRGKICDECLLSPATRTVHAAMVAASCTSFTTSPAGRWAATCSSNSDRTILTSWRARVAPTPSRRRNVSADIGFW
jgi:hypothetical protein